MAKTKTSTKTKSGRRPAAKGASRKAKASSSKSASRRGSSAGSRAVTVDRRRGSRRSEEKQETAAAGSAAAPVKLERRKKVNRRRQIDPTTCERDYSEDEIQFMNALDDYKRRSGRMFPTCSEVLEVVRSLGYVRTPSSEHALAYTVSGQAAEELRGDFRARVANCPALGRHDRITRRGRVDLRSQESQFSLTPDSRILAPTLALHRSDCGALRRRRPPVLCRTRRAAR